MISVQVIRICVRLRGNFMKRANDMVRIRIRIGIIRTNEIEDGIRVRVRVRVRIRAKIIRRLLD